ncbi:MAG TPA: hypothetical protein VFX77_09155, partial [Rubrobacter sp.]|nr:hypothetical protein [Rubrobacter sp.]
MAVLVAVHPTLRRVKISERRYVYLRSELVAWLKNGGSKAGSGADRYPTITQGTRGRKWGHPYSRGSMVGCLPRWVKMAIDARASEKGDQHG